METDRESRRGRKVESWRRAARGGPARGFLLQQQLHHKLSLDGHAQTDQACLGFPAIISYRDEKRTSSSKTLAFFFISPSGHLQILIKTIHKAGMKKKAGGCIGSYATSKTEKKEIIVTCKWMLKGENKKANKSNWTRTPNPSVPLFGRGGVEL